ncbi:MAG: hypothetical protein QNK05_21180 [Myxococcota bacterium]|nr:hypothetical protein [Myxococcota bacterium]
MAPDGGLRSTGLDEIDRLLGGGLPRGWLCELTGSASSGRTSLALALLASTTRQGHWAAWIDRPDALDPGSAEESGVDLEHVLWARPRDAETAVRSAERVLSAGGFDLIGLDLVGLGAREAPSPAAFTRLRRLTRSSDAVLLVLDSERLVGATADLALEVTGGAGRFGEGPSWLEGLETKVQVVRNRSGPSDRMISLRIRQSAAA